MSLAFGLAVTALATLGAMCQKGGSEGPTYADYGESCESTSACLPPLICAGDNTCRTSGEPGTAATGEPCFSSEFCAVGLVCDSDGACASEGSPGTAGFGASCDATEDCQFGYSCDDGVCVGMQMPLWFGGDCEDVSADTGPARGYFEVPGELADFYRLPFPNDIRVEDGQLDLDGHPSPRALIPELGDVVGTVLAGLQTDFDGFGNNQAVFLRFSASPDFSSFELALPADGGTLGIVDLTPGETYGRLHVGSFKADTGRGQYICHNWLALAPQDGRPFLPGHTYAAYVTTGVTSEGSPMAADGDFSEVLAESSPAEGRLDAAWAAYAPLRQWVSEEGVDLVVASVFTAGDPTAPYRLLRDSTDPLAAPVLDALHLCEGDDPGPFATDDERGCQGESQAFFEVQGTVDLPQFQLGTPPFKEPTDGGAIDFSGGAPISSRSEAVQFTLTVPRGEMPADGWPLVLYGHGTGGDTRSLVRSGLADELAEVTLDTQQTVAFATLSIDAVHHGPRRHEENWDASWLLLDPGAYDPDVLYFNPLNPRAARDNALQAAVDYWMLVKVAEELSWSDEQSPTGSAVFFDDADVHYLGHSQGSTTGVAMAAYEPGLRSVVFSAAGGLLIETLLNKVSPNDLGAAIAVGLADPDISRYHPLLNLSQGAGERADPVNHADRLLDPAANPTNVWQVSGLGDTYTPDGAQYALIRAMGSAQVTNGNTPLTGVTVLSPPFSNTHANGTVTGAVGLYTADGDYDAHFVLFNRDDALRQALHFLATASLDGAATVVEP